jgi:hypothetical protein
MPTVLYLAEVLLRRAQPPSGIDLALTHRDSPPAQYRSDVDFS